MAERRMFAKSIVESDAFLSLPLKSQLLYFHLAMNADDDGFVNNVKSIAKFIGCNEKCIEPLIKNKFLIFFEDKKVAVIKHWLINNYIQKDRYTPTKYHEEWLKLGINENKGYSLKGNSCIQNVSKMYPKRIQNGYNLDTQVSIDKISIEKEDTNVSKKETPVCIQNVSKNEHEIDVDSFSEDVSQWTMEQQAVFDNLPQNQEEWTKSENALFEKWRRWASREGYK